MELSARSTSIFLFSDDNFSKYQWIFSRLVTFFVRSLILWRSGFELLMGNFLQFLTEISACDTSKFSFPNDNLSEYQWIFTKLDLCIVEIWFGIADRQIWSILKELSTSDTSLFLFWDDNLSKYQWIFTKLGVCIDIV